VNSTCSSSRCSYSANRTAARANLSSLMYDGVYNVHKKEFAHLADKGVRIAVCAMNAEQRSVQKVGGILFGSQYDHACIAGEVDRFISFG